MRSMRLMLIAFGAVFALSAFGVSSASAVLPLFVSTSGKYPIHASVKGGLARLDTPTKEVHCTSVSGLASLGLHLATYLLLFHECSTTLFLSRTLCNSPGEPPGLIHTKIHGWLGYLTNASTEKMVGVLAQPESGSIDAEFECNANAFEHAKITVLGEAVGAVPAADVNKPQGTFHVKFEESSQGKQTPQTFLLPLPLSLMTGIHLTSDVSGSINEKPESSEFATGETILDGGETAEIQG